MARDAAPFRLSWRVAFPVWWTYWLCVVACFKLAGFLIPTLTHFVAPAARLADWLMLLLVIAGWLPLTIICLKFILETFWGDLLSPESQAHDEPRYADAVDQPIRPRAAYGQLRWTKALRIWFSFMWRLVVIGVCVLSSLWLLTNSTPLATHRAAADFHVLFVATFTMVALLSIKRAIETNQALLVESR